MNDAFYLRLDRVVWWYALVLFVFLALAVGPFVYGAARAVALPDNPDDLGAVWMPLLAVLTLTAAGVAIGFFLLPRLSLVLPAIALRERLSLAGAWRATRGNTRPLAWASLLCSLPPLIPFAPLYWYADLDSRTTSVIVGTIYSLAYVLSVTIAVTLLSLAYRHFVQESGTEAAS